MADVADTLAEWLSTTASNSPSGATTIGTNLDDNLREIQGVIVRGLSHKGSDVASTATADVGAVEGFMHDITGTTSITGLGTVRAGIHKVLKFEGALTLTHNGTSLILPGAANITTADGDVGWFISEGSGNWRCLHYMKANGSHLGPVLVAEQATTSGAEKDFTGIPPWAKKITVMLDSVSSDGTSNFLVQIGVSAGIETTGYVASSSLLSSAVSTADYTTGFGLRIGSASNSVRGNLVLTLQDAANNTWTASGGFTFENGAGSQLFCSGIKPLAGVLDRVRFTTVNGTDEFDAGSVSVMYE